MKPFERTREKKKNEGIPLDLLDITFGKFKIATTRESYHVPLELVPEILSRLPARSMARFRAVSKQWYSITTTPEFIKSFESRLATRPPSLLLTFSSYRSTCEVSRGLVFSLGSKEEYQRVYSFLQCQNHHQTHGSYSYDTYQMTTTSNYWENLKPRQSESVHGLVLLPGFVIWNPTTRQFFTLPMPTDTYGGTTYLGYDPLEGKHKVLHLSKQPQVLTLGAQESWRVITQGTLHWDQYPSYQERGRCFNGILYFDTNRCLMSFDFRYEKFNPPIQYPKDYYYGDLRYEKWGSERPLMIPYEGRLALVSPIICPKVDLRILEAANGHEWTHKCLILPSNIDKIDASTFQGVTEAGELIFTSGYGSSFSILCYDPRRNSIRDSVFEGINGRLIRNIFPNHIESLFSM